MKTNFASLRFASGAAVLTLALAVVGCSHFQRETDPAKRPIPPASVGAASPGIGGPGGDSMDTRAVGTVATGEGNDDSVRSGVAPVTATPHPYRTGQGGYCTGTGGEPG